MLPKLVARLKIKKSLKEIWTEIFREAQADPKFTITVHPVTETEESKKPNVRRPKN